MVLIHPVCIFKVYSFSINYRTSPTAAAIYKAAKLDKLLSEIKFISDIQR